MKSGASSNKRKHVEEADQFENCELNYKVKTYLKDGMKIRQEKAFALPIKTETGALVKNLRKAMVIPVADEVNPVKPVKPAKKEAKLEIETFEKPKSMMQLIQEKKESLEKNKQKIALLSRDVLQNPQEEVGIKTKRI